MNLMSRKIKPYDKKLFEKELFYVLDYLKIKNLLIVIKELY